jgi:hypothetical protein
LNILPDVPGGDALDTKLFVSQQWKEEAPDFYKKWDLKYMGKSKIILKDINNFFC